jgi:hypothetical protein
MRVGLKNSAVAAAGAALSAIFRPKQPLFLWQIVVVERVRKKKNGANLLIYKRYQPNLYLAAC